MRDANLLTPDERAALDLDADRHPTPRWVKLSALVYLTILGYGLYTLISTVLAKHVAAVSAAIGTVLVLACAPAVAFADTCDTPSPGAGWVCVGGGWLPPGHPGIPVAPPPSSQPPPVLPPNTVNTSGFQIGKTYARTTPNTDQRLYILALAQQRSGVAVFVAECLNTRDSACLYVGQGVFLLANATTLGWTVVEPSPYGEP